MEKESIWNFLLERVDTDALKFNQIFPLRQYQLCFRLHICPKKNSICCWVLMNFGEVDKELLEELEKYSSACIVCKRYKPTVPKPAVGNLFDPEKMIFNQMVSIDLKERNDPIHD